MSAGEPLPRACLGIGPGAEPRPPRSWLPALSFFCLFRALGSEPVVAKPQLSLPLPKEFCSERSISCRTPLSHPASVSLAHSSSRCCSWACGLMVCPHSGSQKHLIKRGGTRSPGAAGQVAAGAGLEGQSWSREPGLGRLCVWGSPAGSAPRGPRDLILAFPYFSLWAD